MADLFQQWGSDFTIGPSGDIGMASGTVWGQQRVLRRLLTNPGEYIWQPDYGAGLSRFVGEPSDALQIRAVIRSQIFKELTVAREPEPVIDVDVGTAGSRGMVYVHIRYVDAPAGETQVLSFAVSP